MPLSLNDLVTNFGIGLGADGYNAGKELILDGETQDEFMARFPTISYNEALIFIASGGNIVLGVDNIVFGADNIVLTFS